MERATDEPLALACKWCPEFVDPSDGRVKGYIVREALGLSNEVAAHLGFFEGMGMISLVDQDDLVYLAWVSALNYAWEEVLGEYSSMTAPNITWPGDGPQPPMGFLARFLAGWIQMSYRGHSR